MGGLAERKFVAPICCEARQTLPIAADAETTIADEIACAVVDRKPRQFDAQTCIRSIDGPKERDAAPSVAGFDRFRNAAFRIESEYVRDLAPQPAESRGCSHSDDAGKFVGSEREAAFGIHSPHEAQGMVAPLRWRIMRQTIIRLGRRLDGLHRRNGRGVPQWKFGLRFRQRCRVSPRAIGDVRLQQNDKSNVAAASDTLQHHTAKVRPRSRRDPRAARYRASHRARPPSRLPMPNSGRPASLAATNRPSRENAATGISTPSTSRCNRSTSGMPRPAGSAAVMRMALPTPGNSSREQAQVRGFRARR